MFERFTPEAKAVLVEAQDAAIDYGSAYITPALLFYGCARGRERTAGEPLHDLGITGESILSVVPVTVLPDESAIDPDALRAIGMTTKK
jgi:hypothetical protein